MNFNASNLTSKYIGRMFRRINGVVWDLSSGNIGIQDANGIYTLTKTEVPAVAATEDSPAVAASVNYGISVNPFDNFGMAIPAFATITPFEKVAAGDLIVGDKGILGWVTAKTGAALKLLDFNGMNKNYTPPKVAIGGQDGVLVVQSLGGLVGGDAGLGGLQGALLPLLMAGGDNNELEDILPLMLLQQSQGGDKAAAGLNSMLPMLFLSKSGKGGNGGLKDLLPLMLLGGGLGGNGGGLNPMLAMALLSKDESPLPLTAIRQNGAPALTKLNNGLGQSRF